MVMTDRQRDLIARCRGRIFFRTEGRLWICTVCQATKKMSTDLRMEEWCDAGWKFLETHVECKRENQQ